MRAVAIVQGPTGAEVELGHGDLVGRLRSAALVIDDPRVSEAHAMVSLRGERLKLLPLRGRLWVEHAQVNQVELRPGLVVELVPGVSLRVEDVLLPERLLAIEAPSLGLHVLSGVTSLHLLPRPRLVPGFVGGADAVLWGEELTWKLWQPPGTVQDLMPGARVQVGSLALTAVDVALSANQALSTISSEAPIELVVHYETAQIRCGDGTALITGVPARLLAELVAFDGPAPWDVLSIELWGTGIERDQRRARLDMAMLRLRRRLRDAGIRDDLVVATGTGQIQLVLRSGDRVENRS
ncbi:MAG: hypothetical protein AMXMBFR64_61060 [Myxococcales bacterium]